MVLPASCGSSAGELVSLPSNKPLVSTRKGEAPLLATQRGIRAEDALVSCCNLLCSIVPCPTIDRGPRDEGATFVAWSARTAHCCRKVSMKAFIMTLVLLCIADTVVSEENSVSSEAEQRRARSIALLKKEGVPFIEHLPLIETAADIRPRSTEEVALRAIALAVVAVKGETLDQKLALEIVKRFDIRSALSPDERAFIDDPSPSQHDRVQFAWRYEGLGVMLWALGFEEELGRPDKIVDVAKAVGVLRDLGRDGFIAKAKLRPIEQILDQADLIYRYHWAVTDARVNGRLAPAGLDPGVVYERHYSLNWLMRYADQEWDDISTDT
jgi:hypothetical protein